MKTLKTFEGYFSAVVPEKRKPKEKSKINSYLNKIKEHDELVPLWYSYVKDRIKSVGEDFPRDNGLSYDNLKNHLKTIFSEEEIDEIYHVRHIKSRGPFGLPSGIGGSPSYTYSIFKELQQLMFDIFEKNEYLSYNKHTWYRVLVGNCDETWSELN